MGLGALAAIGGGVMLARKMLSSQLPKMQHVRMALCCCRAPAGAFQ